MKETMNNFLKVLTVVPDWNIFPKFFLFPQKRLPFSSAGQILCIMYVTCHKSADKRSCQSGIYLHKFSI